PNIIIQVECWVDDRIVAIECIAESFALCFVDVLIPVGSSKRGDFCFCIGLKYSHVAVASTDDVTILDNRFANSSKTLLTQNIQPHRLKLSQIFLHLVYTTYKQLVHNTPPLRRLFAFSTTPPANQNTQRSISRVPTSGVSANTTGKSYRI